MPVLVTRAKWLPALLLLVQVSLACHPPAAAPAPPSSKSAAHDVSVVALVELPFEDARSHELSGIAWDEASRTAFAVSDEEPWVVPLYPSADFRSWSFGQPLTVKLPLGQPWDGEGIVLVPSGFVLANETPPQLYQIDTRGQVVRELPLPAHYKGCRHNRCLESLALSPDGRYLFTANEAALEGDGALATPLLPTIVRILRTDLVTLEQNEWAYATEPIFADGVGGDMGVAELVALSPLELLVIERSYVPRTGVSVRVFRSRLGPARGVLGSNLGNAPDVVAKSLLVDLSTLRPPEARQHLLANYEGACLGPRLPDGRRVLLLVSDDNGKRPQARQLLVLAVDGLP